ncbi:complement C3-like [Symphorus nematophorus]
MKQYVYLQAQFPDRLLEKVVLVSFQSGYIFIQTDKTLYTPDSKVLFRMFAVTPHMEPVKRNEVTDPTIVIEIVVFPGLWKVVAKFQSNPQQSYSAKFEVKEYVLPNFEVKLSSLSPFFYVDSEELTVNIRAMYLFGEEIDGTAYVVFGVIMEGQKTSFPSSLQRVPIESGKGEVRLRRDHITQTIQDIHNLVGSSIFVAVSVLTESGGEMVEAELRGIKVVTSPYTIHFKKTPKYFKPGMPFAIVVEVVNPDDTPAHGVAVVVDPGQQMGVTEANGLASVSINTEPNTNGMTITAKTSDRSLPHGRQASATMTALPYTTKNNNYIHISVDTAEVTLGQNLKMHFVLRRQENAQSDITYLILSKGQLVKYGHYKARGQILVYVAVPITKDMLPSFRVIAYYHTNDNEVVSDSVWMDVKDSCMGSLKLEAARSAPSYEPRRMFSLKVTGDPEATVGLVAVDKNVYALNNKHRLTQKKVWDMVDESDTGCTPGAGRDGMSVFYDAGLLFESSSAGTPHRKDVEDDQYMDSDEIISRTSFPESWLWSDIKLPSCPRQLNCDTTSVLKNVPLRDSITTWQFIGISISRTYGICVADPLEVIVRKQFFIDLKLPYSAVRGEQLEIKAILHNYTPDPLTVRVDLFEAEHVCSAASNHQRYHQEVKVGPQTTRSVPFIIIPMKEGQHRIEVKASVRDSSLNDGVMKILRVVAEGILVKSPMVITLDPAKKGVAGIQEIIINSNIPLKDVAPNTPAITQISLTGKESMSAVVENAISGNSMGSLIYQPSGSGESNIAHMTMPVIATVYLDKTNQWETVGFDKRNEALQYIRAGYQKELVFRKNDGSFAVFSNRQGSTWLTAYVAKVFAMANSVVTVNRNIICDAITFLIRNAQQPDGMFGEVGPLYHGEITGDVRGMDSDASMTAFCLIAMQESRTLCAATINSLSASIDRAVAYLERRLPGLTNPYAVAMASYALANENKLNREILFNFVSPELSHWPSPKGTVYTLETTAYALLALVKAEAFEEARPVVRWFNQQQKVGGGYGSTQATIMVHQAVAEYWTNVKNHDFDLDVDFLFPGRPMPNKYNFNKENHHITRTLKVNGINEDVRVTAKGNGEVTLKMVALYYTLPKEKDSDCQKFNLSVELLPVNMDEDERIYKLRIEVLYKDREHDATMSVLHIGLLAGFTVNTHDLDLLSKGHARTIAKYEMNTVLSERGSLIIYLDKVSHTQPEEIAFRIHQKMKVGILQPAAVSVYEYYDQTQCVKFYHPERRNGKLLRLCTNNECTCAEDSCGMQKKGNIGNDERIMRSCESTPTNRIDFVYKVRVESFTNALSTDIYTMRIVQVIKEAASPPPAAAAIQSTASSSLAVSASPAAGAVQSAASSLADDVASPAASSPLACVITPRGPLAPGNYDVAPQGKLRTFISHEHCRAALDLRAGKNYLIMGSSKEIRTDESLYPQYRIVERTWIEYWPTDAECNTNEYRAICLGMEELFNQHMLFGCQDC